MKNIAIALLVCVFGYGYAAAQQPAGQPEKKEMGMEKKEMGMEKKGMKSEKKAKMNMFKGTVEAVDAAAGKITIKDNKGMTMVMPVGAEAKIMKHGKKAMFSDIMVGEMVHVMYEGDMAMPMVKSVKIEKAGMKKEKMEKGEKMEKKAEPKGEMKK